jgi:hypothetical protein
VQQNSDLRVLVASGARVNFHAVVGANFYAHFSRLAVDQHPALFYPRIGLAARAQAKFGHAFVEAGKFCGGV